MASELAAGDEPQVLTVELGDGTPVSVVAAFQQNASANPEAVKTAKQTLEERDGLPYAWDRKTKIFERLPIPAAAVTVQRSPVASPGEQGQRGRSSASPTRGSPDDPDPEPEPVARLRGFVAASVRMSIHERRRLGTRATT
jgi:hypothetical protein